MIQLDPLKTILVFSHIHNTFDKKELLKNVNDCFKPSDKTVEYFIKFTKEAHIKKFFMYDIEVLLKDYEPGLPILKPDVLKQLREIKNSRLNEELKYHHSNFIRCICELENNVIGVNPITEIECLKKLNMDLIIQLKKAHEKKQTGEWDLVEKNE
jgi:hypothetical protein